MMSVSALNTTVYPHRIPHYTGEVVFCKHDSLEMGLWCRALIDFSQAVLSYTLSTAFMFPAGPMAGDFPRPWAVRRNTERKEEF